MVGLIVGLMVGLIWLALLLASWLVSYGWPHCWPHGWSHMVGLISMTAYGWPHCWPHGWSHMVGLIVGLMVGFICMTSYGWPHMVGLIWLALLLALWLASYGWPHMVGLIWLASYGWSHMVGLIVGFMVGLICMTSYGWSHMVGLIVGFMVGLISAQPVTQDALNDIANGLKVKWTVVTNTKEVETFEVEVTLENGASRESLSYGPWKIYFNCIFMIEPDLIAVNGNKGAELVGQGVMVTHVQGSFFYFQPTSTFVTLRPGNVRKIKFKVRYWSVARTDTMHNWFIGYPGLESVVIASTQGENLAFVSERTDPSQWKRYEFDDYNPFSAQQRYDRNYLPYPSNQSEIRLIPKPVKVTMDAMDTLLYLTIDSTWYISYTGPLSDEAEYLRDQLNLDPGHVLPSSNRPGTKVISLRLGHVDLPKDEAVLQNSSDAYYLEINATTQRITLLGNGTSGVFYAVVSLAALMDDGYEVPEVKIVDSPRFAYRGLMMDIARSFHSKDEILAVIELVSMYKLNKLHLHLSDDEGWRLEIKSLPELIEVGSQRCHDMNETRCLLPQLGSGPDNSTSHGSGYLTSADYLEILDRARQRHVTVIPEIDMPGHARAAIVAMKVRKERLTALGQLDEGLRTYLTEENDTSVYETPQMFSDNAINPCLEETYIFVNMVLDELISLHNQGRQPLKTFHFGGDEVGIGAWVNSTECRNLREANQLTGGSPKWHFFQRVSQLAANKGLSLGAWEDGLMQAENNPFNLSTSLVKDVYAYTSENIWEFGSIPRTYTLANRGYKVILSHASHFYFDHPYEPDPEERGFYWATRFTDTRKTFSYNAVRYYDNVFTRRSGQPIADEELCGTGGVNCPPLKSPDNIVGMEATVFSETTRTKDQLHGRLFPRLLAMSERAWHQANWESQSKGEERDRLLKEDWYSFARAVGYRELKRLDKMGVMYNIAPPGARVERGLLLTTSLYPGLRVHYSYDAGLTWSDASGPTVRVGDYQHPIWLRTEESIDMTDKQSESIDMTDKHRESIDMTDKRSESIDMTYKPRESIDMTDKQSESIDMTDKHRESIDMTDKQSESIDMTDKHRESIDMTDKQSESIDMTDKQNESIDMTDKQNESIDMTDDPSGL
ncbi:hypothetical protein Btru_038173 [Bulinus truncatus]|nr:hypothetical protein Btru_038173 [Bulinus truncatus]